jgi:hypothetical protein
MNDALTKLILKQCNLIEPEVPYANDLDALSLMLMKEHQPLAYEAIQKAKKESQGVVDDALTTILQKNMSLSKATAEALVVSQSREGVLDILKQCAGKSEQDILAKRASKDFVIKAAAEAGDIGLINEARSMSLGELTAILALRSASKQ